MQTRKMIQITQKDHIKLAILQANKIVINEVQDIVDLIGNAHYQGACRLVVREEHLHPDFFDLKTGFAGEILQKFSTYNFNLTILGSFEKYASKSLRDFIYESNKAGRIKFLENEETN